MTTCTPSATSICPGDNVVAKVAAQASGTAFTFGAGTYSIAAVIVPKANMSFTGPAFVNGKPAAILDGGRVLGTWTKVTGVNQWWIAGQTQQGTVSAVTCQSIAGGDTEDYPRCNYPEQLWADGVLKKHEATLAACGSGEWFFDYTADRIYVCEDPAGKTVITSVTQTAIQSANAGVTIKRLAVQHFATSGQSKGTVQAMGNNWTMDSLLVRDNNMAGVRAETGTNIKLRWSRVSNNGQYGISTGCPATGSPAPCPGAGDRIDDFLLYMTEIDSNANNGIKRGFGSGAMKITRSRNAVVRRNTVHRNLGNGIWLDIDNNVAIVDSNTVSTNYGSGIFFEISDTILITRNTITDNGQVSTDGGFQNGSGVIISASCCAEVSFNLLSGNLLGLVSLQQNRGAGRVVTDLNMDDNEVHQGVGSTASGYKGDFETTLHHTGRNNRYEGNTWCFPTGTTKYLNFENASRSDAEWTTAGHDTPGGAIMRGGTCP